MDTKHKRRNGLLYVMVVCACSAASFHYGQWSLGTARDAVERSMMLPKPTVVKPKPIVNRYTEC